MKNKFEYLLFLLLGFFVGLFGLSVARKFSYLIALFFFYIIPIRKKTVFENLNAAFPHLKKEKLKKILMLIKINNF